MTPRIAASITLTIANGQTDSTTADLGPATAVGLITPGALTSTSVSFLALAPDDTTWLPVYRDDGSPYTVTVAPSRYTMLDPVVLVGARKVRVRAGAAESAQRSLALLTAYV